MKRSRALLLIALVACLAPIVSTAVSSWIAARHGCRLHDGFIYPCIINGTDYGETLSEMNMMGWFAIFAIPGAVAVILLWTAVEIRAKAQSRRIEPTG